eukprot:4468061-Lingulodinium_polyedra.AAC.1
MEQLMVAFPWLSDIDFSEGFTGQAASASAPASSSSSKEPEERTVVEAREGDLDELAVFKALDSAREALAKEPNASLDDFKTTVLGGLGLQASKGIPKDAVAGVCRSQEAEEWAKRRGVPYTFRAFYS